MAQSPARDSGAEDFQVNEPVMVFRDSRLLEGVVAFTGKVDFAEGLDWVGVRLTGSAVGQGKNDGSVQGKSYFSAPPNSGLFVRKTHVRKRQLTRLEELRLRRELAGAGTSVATSSSVTAAATPSSNSGGTAAAGSSTGERTLASPSPSVGGTTTASTPARSASVASSTTSTTSTGQTQSRLEELRARRAAIQEQRTAAERNAAAAATTTTPVVSRRGRESADTATPAETGSMIGRGAPTTPSETTAAAPPPPPSVASVEQDQSYGNAQELATQVQQLQQELQKLSQEKENQRNQMSNLDNQLQATRGELDQANEMISKLEERKKHEERTVMSESLQQEFNEIQSAKDEAQEKVDEIQAEVKRLEVTLKQEKEAHAAHLDELTLARTQATTWQKEYQALRDQSSSKSSTDASQYKERARFQAELAGHQREKGQWQKEKQDLETALEELTLDKEQLLEEKEALEDKVEELKLDAETASMEVEELKLEVEDARQAMEAAASGGREDDTSEEKIRALSVQNSRLREALIRLREQTTVEKMEQSKQLRSAEKEVEEARALTTEVENLRTLKASFEEQINDLKDMVEQGAAFEGMVEDLSDRVLSLEEDNVALQTTIREMEEGADLTAEVEEVQAEELKALTRDLEGRDAIIHNLEEAIKMQRRREDDFRRTISNYRNSVELLKQEKQALLELQQGGEANKSNLIASSQKALARAAQLVSDAAEMRKREAQYTFDGIDYQVYKHLAVRLEQMLPPSVAAAELAASKGELLTSKVIGIASKALEGIVHSFNKVIKPALPTESTASESPKFVLSDDAKQEAAAMFHQAEHGHVLVEVSADLRRLLAAGQWPDLLTTDVSIELGSILGHSVGDLDSRIGVVLKYLKEEGVLTPEQSNIESLKQSIQVTMQRLQADIEREDAILVPSNWQPPGWQLLKDASTARFYCLGGAAALSSILNQPEFSESPPEVLVQLYNRIEQASSQATNACLRLTHLDVLNSQLVNELTEATVSWKANASDMFKAVHEYVLSDGDSASCEIATSKTLKDLAKLLSITRAAQLNPSENNEVHALSPEDGDCWRRLTGLVRTIREVDGDPEDVNHIIRVREMERHLEQAIANEPKLEQAESRVAQLEKTLSSRSREISMTNARLSELEKQLAKTSGIRSRAHSADVKSAEEFNNLKEENRVLTEAMDVLQRQVDEYENEIRSLKDFKTPKRGAGARSSPRRAITSIADLASPGRGGAMEEPALSNTGALEATIFRPALQNALRDAARWKSAAVASALADLPPLPTTYKTSDGLLGPKVEAAASDAIQLDSALSSYRMTMASVKLVDLTNPLKSPRQQLRESKAQSRIATENLEFAVSRCRRNMFA